MHIHKHIQVCKQFILKKMGSIGIYAGLANDVWTRVRTQTHTYTHNQMHTLQC